MRHDYLMPPEIENINERYLYWKSVVKAAEDGCAELIAYKKEESIIREDNNRKSIEQELSDIEEDERDDIAVFRDRFLFNFFHADAILSAAFGDCTMKVFCNDMIGKYGDLVKPYIKPLYLSVSTLKSSEFLDFDDFDTVESFDVDNFEVNQKWADGFLTSSKQQADKDAQVFPTQSDNFDILDNNYLFWTVAGMMAEEGDKGMEFVMKYANDARKNKKLPSVASSLTEIENEKAKEIREQRTEKMMTAGLEVGIRIVNWEECGCREYRFVEYMLFELGEEIRPYLCALYTSIVNLPIFTPNTINFRSLYYDIENKELHLDQKEKDMTLHEWVDYWDLVECMSNCFD